MLPFDTTKMRWIAFCSSSAVVVVVAAAAAAAGTHHHVIAPTPRAAVVETTTRPTTTAPQLRYGMLLVRGGGGSAAAAAAADEKAASNAPRKRSKKKRKRAATRTLATSRDDTDATSSTTTTAKQKLASAMHVDAAQALGDAIRQRANELDEVSSARVDHADDDDDVNTMTSTVQSIGYALGAADYYNSDREVAPPGPVLAHYFLKSHGGAHGLQSICSLLATGAGLACVLLSSSSSSTQSPPQQQRHLQAILLHRTLLLAMLKHVTGILAAVMAMARAIPDIGLRQTKLQYVDALVRDPVAQYVFYTACLLVWLPPPAPPGSTICWWQQYSLVPALLLGPVLLREVVSSLFVLSDVLVLWSFSTGTNNDATDDKNVLIPTILKVARAVLDAIMSVLVTPGRWRDATAFQRQAMLANNTSRVSLALEVAVGMLLTLDAARVGADFCLATLAQRPPWRDVARRLLCTRLYWHFLWTRRRHIARLGRQMRGGAAQLPMYLLDVLSDPRRAMGLDYYYDAGNDAVVMRDKTNHVDNSNERKETTELDWKSYAKIALGWDEG